MNKSKLCTKAIPYHDILTMQDLIEHLSSWQEPLKLLDTFFSDQQIAVNKKKIIREYHAHAHVFHVFIEDFSQLLKDKEQLLHQMKQADKL
ncbi:hypothetical protein ACYSNR_04935 [Enterococcus sp. LJL128]|uniref:hypothetical protein n=1 Tax=Enterococcus sp. LJL51 TaxID=3416656 RepID=UPI003CF93129